LIGINFLVLASRPFEQRAEGETEPRSWAQLNEADDPHGIGQVLAIARRRPLRRLQQAAPLIIAQRLNATAGRPPPLRLSAYPRLV
jgi:hypothetical protein